MDLNKLEKKSVGTFLHKSDLLEPKKLKIFSLEERPDNFKEGRKKLILGLVDGKKNNYLLEINTTIFNSLVDVYGSDFDMDWKGNLIKIWSVDDGEKDVEGTVRQCYKLQFEKA